MLITIIKTYFFTFLKEGAQLPPPSKVLFNRLLQGLLKEKITGGNISIISRPTVKYYGLKLRDCSLFTTEGKDAH